MLEYKAKLPGYAKDWTDTEKIQYLDGATRLYYFHRKYCKELQSKVEQGLIPGFQQYVEFQT